MTRAPVDRPIPEISVIIPTHNPRVAGLQRALAALCRQTLPPERWEAVLVDNRSTPSLQTAEWSSQLPGLIVQREERLGCAYARLAGIAIARGSLLVFADDDNVLAPDFLSEALAFMQAHPSVGVLGGRITAEFAKAPPRWLERHSGLLALRDFGAEPLISHHAAGQRPAYDYFAPITAGMVLRAAIARDYARWAADSPSLLIGRRGTQLSGCGSEDCQLVYHVLQRGHQCAYSPAISVIHLIPPSRIKFRYLCRLNVESQRSWGMFCRLHFLRPSIPRWTVPLRQAKAFVTRRAWTRAGFIGWRGACGYFAGLAD